MRCIKTRKSVYCNKMSTESVHPYLIAYEPNEIALVFHSLIWRPLVM